MKESSLSKIFVGVSISVISAALTGFVTWAYTKIPEGDEFLPITSFEDVVEKATEVIESADSELWIAVDVPPFGNQSVSDNTYTAYRTALSDASARDITKNILWFSESFERNYGITLGGASERKADEAMAASRSVRSFFPRAQHSELPVLAFNSFWLSKDDSGDHHLLFAWYFFGGTSEPEVRGVYTRSRRLSELAKEVWRRWSILSETREMNRLKEILPDPNEQDG